MPWVMIVMLLYGNSSQFVPIDFKTEAACIAAQHEVITGTAATAAAAKAAGIPYNLSVSCKFRG